MIFFEDDIAKRFDFHGGIKEYTLQLKKNRYKQRYKLNIDFFVNMETKHIDWKMKQVNCFFTREKKTLIIILIKQKMYQQSLNCMENIDANFVFWYSTEFKRQGKMVFKSSKLRTISVRFYYTRNEKKAQIVDPWNRTWLGRKFSFW